LPFATPTCGCVYEQAKKLEELLSKPVTFLDDCVGDATEKAVKDGKDGQIFLLENLRFYAAEEGSSKDAEGKKTKGSSFALLLSLLTLDCFLHPTHIYKRVLIDDLLITPSPTASLYLPCSLFRGSRLVPKVSHLARNGLR
jgi:hypothetical protein